MNKLQKLTILVGVLIIAVMLLFPPWKYVEIKEGDNLERNAGYASVFSPPSLKDHEAIREAFSIPKTRTIEPWVSAANANVTIANANIILTNLNISTPTPTPTPVPTPQVVPIKIAEGDYQVRLDTTRLLIQCAGVLVVMVGFVVFAHD